MNFLAIVGVIGTCLGFYFTYHQLKIAHDRIETYEKFYYWVDKVFDELKNKQARNFYFYGSTILPGNMTLHNDKDPLKSYRSQMLALFKKDYSYKDAFNNVAEAIIIVPHIEDGYDYTYKWFVNHKLNYAAKMTQEDWEREITNRKDEAINFQKEFLNEANLKPDKHFMQIKKHEELDYLKVEYVFMNDIRVVWGRPTHYGGTHDNDPVFTHLVGLSTTNTEIIKAFKQKLNSLKDSWKEEHDKAHPTKQNT